MLVICDKLITLSAGDTQYVLLWLQPPGSGLVRKLQNRSCMSVCANESETAAGEVGGWVERLMRSNVIQLQTDVGTCSVSG